MNRYPLIFLMLTSMLSGCAANHGFPRDIHGDLKPVNSQKVMKDVEPQLNS